MFLSSISSCRNDKCSKKDSCLRYTTENDNIRSETYLVLTKEECNKSKSYINKDEYYKKMILNAINENPKDDFDKKYLLELCYSLLEVSKKYGLDTEIQAKIEHLKK
ncbi:MAG: hypothetical protein HFJ48_05085 [Clostridia bacterium]|nr:hypothetical protein [Clostridia bacterium]